VSSELTGDEVDLRAVTGDAGEDIGVPHGALLVAFSESCVEGDEAERARSRAALADAAGPEAVVEAAATIGNFERMVRIADGTGIPLDRTVALVSADVRADLGIDAFGGARSTQPVRGLQRWLGRAMARMMPLVLRVFRG
jgi:hypothetical protein